MLHAANTDMVGKICMISGANSGLGKVTALELARMNATVVMVCRDRGRGEQAQREIKQKSGNEAVELLLADLSSQQAVRDLAEAFLQEYGQLHILVNNAGIVSAGRHLSVDGLEMTFAVNHLASFLLTNLLLDTIKVSAPARIINVSSIAHMDGFIDLDNLQAEKGYRMMRAYGQSKLANILFTYELARRLEGTGVTVNCLHPGVVAPNIWRQPLPKFLRPLGVVSRFFGVTPEEGAETSIYLASSPEVEGVTGKYFVKCHEEATAEIAYDRAVQQRLWSISAELTGLATDDL